MERTQLFEEIELKFNRLTIFDPRLPHGVREVKGTKDVTKGRLVLSGWFKLTRRASVEGGLTIEDVGKALDAKLEELYEELETLPAMTGFAALRMEVASADGNVEALSWEAPDLSPLNGDRARPERNHRNQRRGVSDYSGNDERVRVSIVSEMVRTARFACRLFSVENKKFYLHIPFFYLLNASLLCT